MKDLVLEAIMHFKCVWPDDYEALIVSTESNDCRGAGEYQNFTGGKSRFDEVTCDTGSWLWVCTKEQFESRLQELRGKAPEGATHFDVESEGDYYKLSCGDYHLMKRNGGIRCGKFDKIIPLPPKQEPKKWKPEVGRECQVFFSGAEWIYAKIVFIGNEVVVFEDGHGNERTAYKTEPFRPLKTEAEKERENLIARAYYDVSGDEPSFDEFMDSDMYSWCETLIDAGWRPADEIGASIMKSCNKHGIGGYWREIAADVFDGVSLMTGPQND